MPVSKPVPYRLAIPHRRGEPQTRRNMAGVPRIETVNAGIKKPVPYRLAIFHPYNAYR